MLIFIFWLATSGSLEFIGSQNLIYMVNCLVINPGVPNETLK